MALDDAAADAAVNAWLDGIDPPMSEAAKASVRSGIGPLIRAVYAGIVANAVVSPAGAPAVMAAGGDNVTGTGKIT